MTAKVVIEAAPRRPLDDQVARLARVAREITPDHTDLEAWLSRYRVQHLSRLAVDLTLLERYAPPSAVILDVGAVPLLLTAALADRDHEVHGLDIAPERFGTSIARLGLDVRRCDIETEAVPFGDETFDVVVCNEVFEHLRINPIFTMRELRRVLKPSGSLVLSTPNLRSFRGLRNLIVRGQAHTGGTGVYDQYAKLDTLGHMGHVREYTPAELVDFLARVGFRAERVVFRGGHGRGLIGLAERVMPRWLPFFTVIARKSRPEGAV